MKENGVETKALNQAVKRNIERFPKEFCFKLSSDEFSAWRSQLLPPRQIKKDFVTLQQLSPNKV